MGNHRFRYVHSRTVEQRKTRRPESTIQAKRDLGDPRAIAKSLLKPEDGGSVRKRLKNINSVSGELGERQYGSIHRQPAQFETFEEPDSLL